MTAVPPGSLRFDGRAVLITGAARGIGRAHALLLAERGARVLVNDVGTDVFGQGSDGGPAAQTVREIRAAGGVAEVCLADLRDEAGARSAVRATVESFGRIDAIVHNAGFTLGGRPFADDSLDRLDALLAVNVRAGFALANEAWPMMLAQGYGRLIFTSSTAVYGMAGSVAYSTAKAALIGLTRALADEGAAAGIRVNSVAPAGATRMAENLQESAFRSWFLATMRPELVSPVVAVLAHESCRVTGELFVAGGGRVARTRLAETAGTSTPTLTPEDVRDRLPALLADTDYAYPRSTAESVEFAAGLLGHHPNEHVTLAAGTAPAPSQPSGRTT